MFQIVVKEYHGAGILAAGFGYELRVASCCELREFCAVVFDIRRTTV